MLFWTCLGIMLVMVSASAVVGISLCNLLPYRLRPVARFYFSPLLGLTVFIFIATIHGWFVPFKQWSCIAEGLFVLAISFYFIKKKAKLLPYLLIIIPYAIVVSLTVLFPLLRYDAFNSFNDAFTYLVHGQWLQEHAFSEPAVRSGNYPALTQVALYQAGGMRMGASFFLGWTQAVFGLAWSYYAYPAVIALPLIAGSLAVGGAIKLMVIKKRLISILMGCLTATAFNGFAFGASYGFFPQTFGLALAAGATTLLAGLIKQNMRTYQLKKTIRNCLPVALIFGALALCYNDLLLFIGAGLFVFMVIIAISNPSKIKTFIMVIVVLLLQIAVLVNVEFVRIIRNLLNAVIGVGSGLHRVGWPIFWKPVEFLSYAFGLRAPVENGWLLGNEYISVTVCVIMVFAIIFFLMKCLRTPFAAYLYLNASVLMVFIAGFIYFRYITSGPTVAETGNTFLQFKITKWASPFCFIFIGASIAYICHKKRVLSILITALLLVMVILTSAGNYVLAEIYSNNYLQEIGCKKAAFNELLKLRVLIKNISNTDVIYLNLGSVHHKLRQLVAYILYDRKVAGDYTDDGYIYGHLPHNQQSISFNKANWIIDYIGMDKNKDTPELKVGNIILKKRPDYQISLLAVTGGYGREIVGDDWWYWTSDSLEFKYKTLGIIKKKIKLKFGYMPGSDGRKVKILIRSNKTSEMMMRMKLGWNEFETQPIEIYGTDLSIKFSSDERLVPISATDKRMVSFLIKNLELMVIN
jgi:hypothetical protein